MDTSIRWSLCRRSFVERGGCEDGGDSEDETESDSDEGADDSSSMVSKMSWTQYHGKAASVESVVEGIASV